MGEIVEKAINAAMKRRQAIEEEQDKMLLSLFGFSREDFAREGIIIDMLMEPCSIGLRIQLKDGTWSDTVLSLEGLGEVFLQARENGNL